MTKEQLKDALDKIEKIENPEQREAARTRLAMRYKLTAAQNE